MYAPNLLATKLGRLSTFFFLYVSEGLPQGFAKMALVMEMRKTGMSVEDTTRFTAVVFLPWAWKWVIGPFVDIFHSDKLGRRRAWIVAAQIMMVGSLLLCMPVDFSMHLKLFTILLVMHNIFAATQDVAIDALACETLKEDERGLANGLMFGGAHTGYLIGGAGALALIGYLGFNAMLLVLCGTILAITFSITIWLREPRREADEATTATSPLERFGHDVWQYLKDVTRAILGSRAALVGVFFALLPHGVLALDVPIRMNLGYDLNFDDADMSRLETIAGIIWIAGCIVGGFLSDHFGRRRAFAIYVIGSCLPALWLAWELARRGWNVPAAEVPTDPSVALSNTFWWACMVFSVFSGLLFGARAALFMDITTPAVAATQFTAYMALLNLTTSYVNFLEGEVARDWGYPALLSIECVAGVLCIVLLPLMTTTRPRSQDAGEPEA